MTFLPGRRSPGKDLAILIISITECSIDSDFHRVPRMEEGRSDRINAAGRLLEGAVGKGGERLQKHWLAGVACSFQLLRMVRRCI
jgi:hypothetical protein